MHSRLSLRGSWASWRKCSAAVTAAYPAISLPTRNPARAAWLVLRAPEGKHLRSVEVDGKAWTDFDPSLERIALPMRTGEIRIKARF